MKKSIFIFSWLFWSSYCLSNQTLNQLKIWDTELYKDPQSVQDSLRQQDITSYSNLEKLKYFTLLIASYNLQYQYENSIDLIKMSTFPTPLSDAEKEAYYFLSLKIAWPYEMKNQVNIAEKWYLQAQELATELKDREKQAFILLQFSALESAKGREVSALELAKEANSILINTKDLELWADLNSQLGILYYLQQDYSSAIKHYSKVLSIAKDSHSIQESTVAHYNLANAYAKWAEQLQDNVAKVSIAEHHYITSLNSSKKHDLKNLIRNNLLGIISLYSKNNLVKKADQYVNELISLNLTYQGYTRLSYSLVLSTYYLKTNDEITSLKYLSNASDYFNDSTKKYPSYAIKKLQDIAQLYVSLGKHRDAYNYLNLFQKHTLSMYKKNITAEVMELKSEIDNQKLMNNNLLLNINNQKQKTSLIIFSVLIILLISLLYRSHQKKKILFKISTTDYLTESHNRRYIFEVGDKDFHKNQFSVVIMDIDFFKKINDRFGHDAGDIVLKSFASSVKHNIRKGDYFGRIGGEEFLILFSKINSKQLVQKMEDIRTHVNQLKFEFDDVNINITASYGLRSFDATSVNEMVKLADKALYKAKQRGRDRIELAE